jgi:exopolyphosphatase / guanosine-5'-triphosphate,3'-diphosphate pyrophosphatase
MAIDRINRPSHDVTTTQASSSTQPVILGVIDVGASAIRAAVAQQWPGAHSETLEEASRAVPLGRDTFSAGRISGATMDAAIRALAGFKQLMDGYGVSRVNAVATSAVREAANAETFLDRVRVRTGLVVEVIDGSEESRLTYLAVRAALGDHPVLAAPAALLIEVGGGSVDLTRLSGGQPVEAGVYPLGSIRLRQRLSAWHGSHEQRIRLLTAHVSNVVGDIVDEVHVGDASFVVALGGDMRFVASQVAAAGDAGSAAELSADAFLTFVADLVKCDEDTLAARYHLSPMAAETLVPSMLVYRALVTQSSASTIVVPDVSLRDGLLVDMAGAAIQADFAPQVLASAASLGTRYRYDAAHAAAVARLATRLFDLVVEEHGLGSRDRLLLEVAALLHDIGLFVSLRGHHKHTLYLLQASEIFGLSREDMQIVGNIARYHRRGLPQKSHPEFMRLDRDERVRVTKLAAMLRLANALDAEHEQKVTDITLQEADRGWILELTGRGDLTMERLAAAARADMLVDVFGRPTEVRGAGAGA